MGTKKKTGKRKPINDIKPPQIRPTRNPKGRPKGSVNFLTKTKINILNENIEFCNTKFKDIIEKWANSSNPEMEMMVIKAHLKLLEIKHRPNSNVEVVQQNNLQDTLAIFTGNYLLTRRTGNVVDVPASEVEIVPDE